ncbi:C-type lectin domain family 4 member M-like isoform X2 [Gigantopelta aegis]|uniref:C-type lectin domain family 4 member M-like isoform X2 n=1 Tax=Gigantopelta aegis TaxID=1735272 RepID=UPI001B88A127|nr:C-type lectin domain family 4 member M-like isoform X2 [Gigantopelta aegis]
MLLIQINIISSDLSNSPISGLSEYSANDMFSKSDDIDLSKLMEAVDELKRRLQELETEKADLLVVCNEVTTLAAQTAQAASQSAGTAETVDTSNLAVIGELGGAQSKISQLKTAVETLVKKESSGVSTINTASEIKTDVSKATKTVNEYTQRISYLKKQTGNLKSMNAQQTDVETSTANGCPSGFTEIEGHCYGQPSFIASQPSCHAICAAVGAYLVQPETKSEWENVKNFINQHGGESVYIGLTDALVEGQWTWSHGGKLLSSAMNKWIWSPQQPDNWWNSEHVIDMVNWQGFTFNDLSWGQKFYAVCEIGEDENGQWAMK